MAENVDFEELKRTISLGQVLDHYGLLDALRPAKKRGDKRGPCPACDAQKAFYVYQEGKFYCHGCKTGGTVIDLVMLLEGCTVREAGLKLKRWFLSTDAKPASTDKVEAPQGKEPPSPVGGETPWKDDLTLLWDYLDELNADGTYYEALGRLEDVITTYAPFEP